MIRILLLLFFICSFLLKASGQDSYVDSLERVISKSGNNADVISTRLTLAKYYYFVLVQNDKPITEAEQSRILAKQLGIAGKEVEAMYWKAYFTWGAQIAGAEKIITDALVLARQQSLNNAASDLLTLQARVTIQNKDSAKRMVQQALSIAIRYQLPEQEANALAQQGSFYTSDKPDTARGLFSRALSIVYNTGTKKSAIRVLRTISQAWLTVHTDTAIYYLQQALHIAQQNGLVDEELYVLRPFTLSQSGYFLRDSLEKYYARELQIAREYKRDSLTYMRSYIQTAQDIGNYTAALQTGFQCLRISEQNKDSSFIQQTLYYIGLSYEYSFDYARAIIYLNKAKPLRKWDGFTYVFALDDLARCYAKLHQLDSARYYGEACYKAASGYFGGAASIYGGVLNDLGIIYMAMGEDSIAINYLRRAYAYFITQRVEPKNYTVTTDALAAYFDKHEMRDSALFYARLAFGTARENGFLENVTTTSELIARYYKNKNKDSAYYFQSIGFDAYKKIYSYESSRDFQNLVNTEQQREEEVAAARKLAEDKYVSNLKLYGLLTALIIATLIGLISYRNSRQRRKSYELLKQQKQEIDLQKLKLEESLTDLKATQMQLIQSEKMASLGELTAGIAHEIQNPLNFVNNFSEVNTELLDELKSEMAVGNLQLAGEVADNIRENEKKISHHGKRADAIVKGMLQHSRKSEGVKEPTDINALVDEYLRLSYHGFRANDKEFNAGINTDFDRGIEKVNIIPQDIGRVLLNLYNNAFYAVNEKRKEKNEKYEPAVVVSTKKDGNKVVIKVSDNGNGIPQGVVDKIFQPFFTTKPTGQGTGLGLSLAYDIVKAHGGEIKVKTSAGQGSEFIIYLP